MTLADTKNNLVKQQKTLQPQLFEKYRGSPAIKMEGIIRVMHTICFSVIKMQCYESIEVELL